MIDHRIPTPKEHDAPEVRASTTPSAHHAPRSTHELDLMDLEHGAWLAVLQELGRLHVDINSLNSTPLYRALWAWGHRLVELRRVQPAEARDVVRTQAELYRHRRRRAHWDISG